jgi:hypothetical protein
MDATADGDATTTISNAITITNAAIAAAALEK